MNTLQLSIVHRLPSRYRWSAGLAGISVEPIPPQIGTDDNALIGLKLLSPNGEKAWTVMRSLSQDLIGIAVNSAVLEWEGEPCLFVEGQDEFAAICCLKNSGVAIAENVNAANPF
ncbi:YejG family protein [Apirhabdus apintestini]|uniref:YejG family protein n=1 Tax=Erwinia sp. HR93 TaxID=3094840 RepID=UPI002ADEDDCB|nr:YejG family protein [Erwinia sp. HR93]MEA1065504.1 YejG family protein [Erwinia sp. HR93]WPM85548.1 YejG family protein [Enterobacteriaceae bacterium CA-0114]